MILKLFNRIILAFSRLTQCVEVGSQKTLFDSLVKCGTFGFFCSLFHSFAVFVSESFADLSLRLHLAMHSFVRVKLAPSTLYLQNFASEVIRSDCGKIFSYSLPGCGLLTLDFIQAVDEILCLPSSQGEVCQSECSFVR